MSSHAQTNRITDPKLDYQRVVAPYSEDLNEVEKSIARHFRSDVALIPQISSYLIGGGGKRIRPFLVIATSRLCGYSGATRHITMSVVAEYIHAATLLHDDVVDDADKRRGGESANVKFGNQASVLVGDFLFATSFTLMSEDNDTRIISAMADATKSLAEGEILQLVNTCNLENTESVYMDTIYRKTGALMEACCKTGAILGGASKDKEDAITLFGKNIGIAFQLVDDALDFVGDDAVWGKPLGADLAEGKVTLPLIKALAACDDAEKALIQKVIEAEHAPEKEEIAAIIEILNKYQTLTQTLAVANDHIEEAKTFLDRFEPSDDAEALFGVADYIVSRNI